jgi:vacuolar-type H+-ATPase subunit I/STV1
MPVGESASWEMHTRDKYLGSNAVVGALRALQRKIRELQGENDALKEEIGELRSRLKECREQEINEEMHKSVSRERTLMEQLDTLESRFKAGSKRRDPNSAKLLEAATLLSSLKLQLSNLSAEHEATIAENAALQEKCSQYETKLIPAHSRSQASIQAVDFPVSKSQMRRVSSSVERSETAGDCRGKHVKRAAILIQPDEDIKACHLLSAASTPLLFRPVPPNRSNPRVLIQSLAPSPSRHSTSTTV